jgi:hypothetical protein
MHPNFDRLGMIVPVDGWENVGLFGASAVGSDSEPLMQSGD